MQPPKGTRDFLPEEMILRRRVMETIRDCFVLYGFVEIDSPFLNISSFFQGNAERKSKRRYTPSRIKPKEN